MKNIIIFKTDNRSYGIFKKNNKFYFLTASAQKSFEDWVTSIEKLKKVPNLDKEKFILKEHIKFFMDFDKKVIPLSKLNYIAIYHNYNIKGTFFEYHLEEQYREKIYNIIKDKKHKYITCKWFKNYLYRIYFVEENIKNELIKKFGG